MNKIWIYIKFIESKNWHALASWWRITEPKSTQSNIFEWYPLTEIEKRTSSSYQEANGMVQLEAGSSLGCSLLATACSLSFYLSPLLVGPADASSCTVPFASLHILMRFDAAIHSHSRSWPSSFKYPVVSNICMYTHYHICKDKWIVNKFILKY